MPLSARSASTSSWPSRLPERGACRTRCASARHGGLTPLPGERLEARRTDGRACRASHSAQPGGPRPQAPQLPMRSGWASEHRGEEDLHAICTRPVSLLHMRELSCGVTAPGRAAGNRRFTRGESLGRRRFPVHADGWRRTGRSAPAGDGQKGGQHVCAGDPGPCVRRRAGACAA